MKNYLFSPLFIGRGYVTIKCICLFVMLNVKTISLFSQDLANFTGVTYQTGSPTFSGFASRVNTSVDYYRGRANISVPIYTLKAGDIEIPILLKNTGSGVIVDELYSSVGMGWQLVTSGMVKRTVAGRNDYKRLNLSHLNPKIPDSATDSYYFIDGHKYSDFKFLENCFRGKQDITPDIFSYSFCGYSGIFVIKEDGSILQIPKTDLKIELISDPTNLEWREIVISDSKGNKFYFGEKERTSRQVNMNMNQDGNPQYQEWFTYNTEIDMPENITGWFLSKIVTSSGNEIDFTYTQDDYSYSYKDEFFTFRPTQLTELRSSPLPERYFPLQLGEDFLDYSLVNVAYSSKKLSNISYNDKSVDFVYYPEKDNHGPSLLDRVELKYKGEVHKKFDFLYSSSNSNADAGLPVPGQLNYRPWLHGFKVYGKTDLYSGEDYRFEYYTGDFPERFKNCKDLFGYYNGKNNNLVFFPGLDVSVVLINGVYRVIEDIQILGYNEVDLVKNIYGMVSLGGDGRLPNETYAKIGALKKIVYPTKGYSEFVYESHKIKDNNSSAIGGLRIKEIKDYESNGVLLNSRTYSYVNSDGTSSGKFFNVPQFTELAYNAKIVPEYNNELAFMYYLRVSGNPTSEGRHTVHPFYVGYLKVSEQEGLNGENGKTEYVYNKTYCFSDNKRKIVPDEDYSYRNGLLNEKLRYSYDGISYNLIEKYTNYYSFDQLEKTQSAVVYGRYLFPEGDKSYYSYLIPSERCKLDRTNKEQWLEGVKMEEITTFTYNQKHNKPVLIATTSSSGKEIKKEITYSKDLVQGLSSISDIMLKNNINKPFEESNYVGDIITGGAKLHYTYRVKGSDTLVFHLKQEEYQRNGVYKTRIEISDYSANCKPVEIKREDGIKVTNIWGYDDEFVVAQVVNAKRSEVLFKNFEEEGFNPSRKAVGVFKTGESSTKACYVDWSNKSTISLIPNKKYRISFWTKKGTSSSYSRVDISGVINVKVTPPIDGKWVYKEVEFTAPTNISSISNVYILCSGGSDPVNTSIYNYVDDLRIYPADADMTSYTFEPLNGMSSVTDNNSKINYYLYDVFGRLKQIKDSEGNIIEEYEYNYSH